LLLSLSRYFVVFADDVLMNFYLLVVFAGDVDCVDLDDAVPGPQSAGLCRRTPLNALYIVTASVLDGEQVEPVALEVRPDAKMAQS